MDQTLSAVYEHGSLRLLDPVDLAESSPVQVQIFAPENNFQTLAFKRQIMSIRRLLTTVEEAWEDELVRDVFPTILRADLHTLWQVGCEPHRTLCALLQLAAARLQAEQLTHEQIAAIRFALDHLAQSSFTEADIFACHARLLDANFPPAFALDAEAIQSYVDEL